MARIVTITTIMVFVCLFMEAMGFGVFNNLASYFDMNDPVHSAAWIAFAFVLTTALGTGIAAGILGRSIDTAFLITTLTSAFGILLLTELAFFLVKSEEIIPDSMGFLQTGFEIVIGAAIAFVIISMIQWWRGNDV